MKRHRFACLVATGMALLVSEALASNCAVDMYDHNGSLMEVQLCDNYLGITYVRPRAGLPPSVVNGTLLFEGSVSGIGAVSGQSRLFSAACGELTYDVEGAVRPSSILLTGIAPVRDANCRVTRYRDDELLFTLQAAAAPRALAPRPVARPPRATPRPRAAVPPRAATARPAPRPQAAPPPQAPTGDWYAIAGAFRDFAGAADRVSQLPSGWAVKKTDECRNFTNGFWIAAIGPLSEPDADAWRAAVPSQFQPYIKSCN